MDGRSLTPGVNTLERKFPKLIVHCDPPTSIISTTWEIGRNADPWAPFQTFWFRHSGGEAPGCVFWWALSESWWGLKFENQHPSRRRERTSVGYNELISSKILHTIPGSSSILLLNSLQHPVPLYLKVKSSQLICTVLPKLILAILSILPYLIHQVVEDTIITKTIWDETWVSSRS